MKKIVTVGASIIITTMLALTITSLPALALGEGGFAEGVEAARGNGVPTNLWNGDSSLVRRVINFMLIGIAVVSVVMLIFIMLTTHFGVNYSIHDLHNYA